MHARLGGLTTRSVVFMELFRQEKKMHPISHTVGRVALAGAAKGGVGRSPTMVGELLLLLCNAAVPKPGRRATLTAAEEHGFDSHRLRFVCFM